LNENHPCYVEDEHFRRIVKESLETRGFEVRLVAWRIAQTVFEEFSLTSACWM